MSYRFRAEINELKQHGIGVADLLPDEIVALVHAVDRVTNPFTEVNLDALGMPLYDKNGVRLWPLTIGACVWLEEYARKWWNDRPKAYFWAVVYCLQKGREANAFDNMLVEAEAYEAIKQSSLKLCVCENEITEAVDTALNFKRPARRKGESVESGTDWASIVCALEAKTGIEAEKWLWRKSADYAVRAYAQLRKFAEMEGGKRGQRMKDELDHAINQLAAVRCSIVERIKAERAGAK